MARVKDLALCAGMILVFGAIFVQHLLATIGYWGGILWFVFGRS